MRRTLVLLFAVSALVVGCGEGDAVPGSPTDILAPTTGPPAATATQALPSTTTVPSAITTATAETIDAGPEPLTTTTSTRDASPTTVGEREWSVLEPRAHFWDLAENPGGGVWAVGEDEILQFATNGELIGRVELPFAGRPPVIAVAPWGEVWAEVPGSAGLVAWDGRMWLSDEPDQELGLPFAISLDEMWALSFDTEAESEYLRSIRPGLSRRVEGRWTPVDVPADCPAWQALRGTDGTVWVSAFGNDGWSSPADYEAVVCSFDGAAWTIHLMGGIPEWAEPGDLSPVSDMIEDAKGQIVFATRGGGIRRLDAGDLVAVGSDGPVAPERLLVGPNGALWAVGDDGDGLYQLVEEYWQRSPVSEALGRVEQAVFDDQGVLWITAETGLVRYPVTAS